MTDTPDPRSQNARKHGLYSKEGPLFEMEQQALTALTEEYMEEWQPVGPTERNLVEELASYAHRMARIRAMECSSIDYQTGLLVTELRKIDRIDAPLAQTLVTESKHTHLDFLGRQEARLARLAREARKQLAWLQDRRAKKCAETEPKSHKPQVEQKKLENKMPPLPDKVSLNDLIGAGLVPGLDQGSAYSAAHRKLAEHLQRMRRSEADPPPNDVAA